MSLPPEERLRFELEKRALQLNDPYDENEPSILVDNQLPLSPRAGTFKARGATEAKPSDLSVILDMDSDNATKQ
jgi:hypothetical protein